MAYLDRIINLRKTLPVLGSFDDTISEASTGLGLAKIGVVGPQDPIRSNTHHLQRKAVSSIMSNSVPTAKSNTDQLTLDIPGCFPEAEPRPIVNSEILPAIASHVSKSGADIEAALPQSPLEKHIVIQEPKPVRLDDKDHFLPTPCPPKVKLQTKRSRIHSSRTFRQRTFIAKICVLSVLVLHAGFLLGYEIAEVTSQTAQVRIMMLILTVLSALGAMVVILTVDAASRGPKRVLALYPLLGAITGAMLWVPLGGGVGTIRHTTVHDEQWMHWMVLCGWLGFLFEFIFGSWKHLFRTVLRRRLR